MNAMSREKLLPLLLRDVKKDHDYILVDCSPSLGMITINALTAADSVIIPVQTQYLPAKGMTQLLRSINMVRTHTNEHLKIGGIVMTLVDGRTNLAKEVINTIRTNYGMSIKIFDMTMFTRHMSLVSYLQQVQIALIMILRLMESQLSKRSIDLWIVAASVKWMLLFIKDGEKVIR